MSKINRLKDVKQEVAMKNAERIYKEFMNRLTQGKVKKSMELIVLETEDWTNNFAVIQANWNGGTLVDYTLYWIPTGRESPQPIRTYSELNRALAVFFQLKYNESRYTEYPF